ncbi:uncharacterized protein K02A2.6-like [Armigeres subalbatus]|uniref:uncharacterized protein K02A2.6-like n=1 Tax=Armigeres subalbatus TaxID=124917 RepID=UPI002ED0EFC4
MSGWPSDKSMITDCTKPYFAFRHELVIQDGIILRRDRIVIPTASRKTVSNLLHYSHQGEQATLRKARSVVYWPNMNDHLRNFVKACDICNRFKGYQQCEPMQSSQTATYPFEIVSMDIGEVSYDDKKLLILVTVDHFSNYFEVNILTSQATKNLIDCTKQTFTRLGIPRRAITDSAKQFLSVEWQTFMRNYGVVHTTSAPYHHESNGKAESAIKIAKNIIKKALHDGKDFWLALLEWRNTPQDDGYSPAQKIMGRYLRGLCPVPSDKLKIRGVNAAIVNDQMETRKIKSKFYHDRKSQSLPTLERGQDVYVQLKPETNSIWTKGRVAEILSDRDYNIEVNGNSYRRNRVHIRESRGIEESWKEEDTEDHYLSLDGQDLTVPTSTPNADQSRKAEPESRSRHSDNRNCNPGSTTTAVGTSSLSTPVVDRPQRAVRRPLKFKDYVLDTSE